MCDQCAVGSAAVPPCRRKSGVSAEVLAFIARVEVGCSRDCGGDKSRRHRVLAGFWSGVSQRNVTSQSGECGETTKTQHSPK